MSAETTTYTLPELAYDWGEVAARYDAARQTDLVPALGSR